MRALCGILLRRRSRFRDLHFKIDRKVFRRIAGSVVAGLVSELAAKCILAGDHVSQGTDRHRQREPAPIDAQLLVRGEWKAGLFSGRISDFSHHDVGWWIQLQSGWDEEFGFRSVGINVKSRADTELKLHRSRLTASDGRDRNGRHCY